MDADTDTPMQSWRIALFKSQRDTRGFLKMKLTTCLWFDGRAREAANFYTSIFPDSSISDNWIAPTDTPGNKQGDEVVVNFTIFGQAFIALNGGPQFPHSEAISFQIPCSDQGEIDKYWSILTADGGQESKCGWLKDKFGISWQVSSPEMNFYLSGPDPKGAQRATQAMLAMKKIDLAAMRKAYSAG
jgi:predicted 3-demethylubiquinone-9 3-methyltransferase (glyoxalase superfamily)